MVYNGWAAIVSMLIAFFLYFQAFFDQRFVNFERHTYEAAARTELSLSLMTGLIDWSIHVGLFDGTRRCGRARRTSCRATWTTTARSGTCSGSRSRRAGRGTSSRTR
jgi:hypothetical protein